MGLQGWPSPHPTDYTGDLKRGEVTAVIRSISIALAFVAGSAAAGETMDCFNDEADADVRYTSAEPEALRITDADVEKMLRGIRENERYAVADRDEVPESRLSLLNDTPVPD